MKQITYNPELDCFVDQVGEKYEGKSLPHHLYLCSPDDCSCPESAYQLVLEELLKKGHLKGADAYEIISSIVKDQKPYYAKITAILYKTK